MGGTEVGVKAKEVMAAGQLVNDDIVINIIHDRIQEADCSGGFILDGFPRTVAQAEALDAMLGKMAQGVSKIIEFNVPDEVLIGRIEGRWIHKPSGRSYHAKFNPPRSFDGTSDPSGENMLDDVTSEPLTRRSDDTREALSERLSMYHRETKPVLAHYKGICSVRTVNANQTVQGVWADIVVALDLQKGEI